MGDDDYIEKNLEWLGDTVTLFSLKDFVANKKWSKVTPFPTHPPTHPPIHPPTQPTHPPTHPPTHSSTHLPSQPPTHPPTQQDALSLRRPRGKRGGGGGGGGGVVDRVKRMREVKRLRFERKMAALLMCVEAGGMG